MSDADAQSFNEAPHFHAGKGEVLPEGLLALLVASMRPRTFMRGRYQALEFGRLKWTRELQ